MGRSRSSAARRRPSRQNNWRIHRVSANRRLPVNLPTPTQFSPSLRGLTSAQRQYFIDDPKAYRQYMLGFTRPMGNFIPLNTVPNAVDRAIAYRRRLRLLAPLSYRPITVDPLSHQKSWSKIKAINFAAPVLSTLSDSASGPLICVRRQMRREVIFARGHAGKVGQRKPRFTQNSKILCKDT